MSRSGKLTHGPWDVCGECREASGEAGVHVLCALHAAAPALLEALKKGLDGICNYWCLFDEDLERIEHERICTEARAAAAAAEEGR